MLEDEKEKLYNDVDKLKTLWITQTNPNLWQQTVKNWNGINMIEIRMKCNEFNSRHEFEEWLYAKYHLGHNLTYRTTIIDTWKPKNDLDRNYKRYKQNIMNNFDKKEYFHYHWKCEYEIFIEGSTINNEFTVQLILKHPRSPYRDHWNVLNENLALLSC